MMSSVNKKYDVVTDSHPEINST